MVVHGRGQGFTLCSPAPGAVALHLSLPSSASSLLNRPLVAATVGQNISLPCNLTSCSQVTWFTVRDDSVLPLLTARRSHVSGGDTVERHSLGADRARPEGAQDLQHLLLLRVEEADAGLYFCSGRCGGALQVGPGVSLLVGGKRTHRSCVCICMFLYNLFSGHGIKWASVFIVVELI